MSEGPGTEAARREELLRILLEREGLGAGEAAAPGPRPEGVERAPLSFTQERLWRTGKLAEGTPFGNFALAFRLSGSLDTRALGGGVADLIRRHEILRTRVVEGEDALEQVVDPAERGPPLECRDVRAEEDPAGAALELVRSLAERPFDLAREHPVRPCLASVGEGEWVFALVVHHIASDGWGFRVLLQDLSALYRARVGDGDGPGDLPYQYADYAIWEREWLRGSRKEEQVRAWRKRLEGVPGLRIPLKAGAPTRPTFRGEAVPLQVPSGPAEALRAIAREESSTLYTVLLTGLQVLLRSWAPGHTAVVGTTISNRTRRGSEALVGNLGNNLLLTLGLQPSDPFRAALRGAREAVAHAYRYPALPLEALAETGSLRIPPFQTMFVLRQGSLEAALELPGIDVVRIETDLHATAVDVTVDLTETGGAIEGTLTFRSDRIEGDVARALASRYASLLEEVARSPERAVEDLPAAPSCGAAKGDGVERPREGGPRLRGTEELVAELWREALDVEGVGPSDNFYDLGGHSLAAAGVIARLEEQTGVRLGPVEFGFQTLGQIARMCDERGAGGSQPRPRRSALDGAPPEPERDDAITASLPRPTFFPDGEGPLYGVLHPAEVALEGAPAALLCPPAALEYAATHRALRVLAERLAAAGMPALRFDWRGTGDSWDSEGGRPPTLDEWREDLGTAAAWLLDATGSSRVVLIGVRLGAALALLEADRACRVRDLVLWSPVVTGDEQIGDLEASLRRVRREVVGEVERDPPDPALPLPEGVATLDLRQAAPSGVARILLVDEEEEGTMELVRGLRRGGVDVEVRTTPDSGLWRDHDDVEQRVPSRTLDLIVDWIGDR